MSSNGNTLFKGLLLFCAYQQGVWLVRNYKINSVVASVIISTLVPTLSAFSAVHKVTPVAFSIKVSGSHFVNGAGQTVRLVGVGGLGTESACIDGTGYTSTPLNDATVSAISAWHANVVRIGLNEDCWLGLNAQPAFGTPQGYRHAIMDFVQKLSQARIYAILSLQISAPDALVSTSQMSMPDAHSIVFWSSVANAFKANPAVIFDVFSEPYSPDQLWANSPGVPWSCWLAGGCQVPVLTPSQSYTRTPPMYVSVGLERLVWAIRWAGGKQPIMLAGLNFANDLSGVSSNAPFDFLQPAQLAMSFHTYQGESCVTATCWNNTVAPLAKKMPVVAAEFGEAAYCASPTSAPTTSSGFDKSFMTWSDAHGTSYLASGWVVNGHAPSCSGRPSQSSGFGLINDLSGTPTSPDGQVLKDHLTVLRNSNALH